MRVTAIGLALALCLGALGARPLVPPAAASQAAQQAASSVAAHGELVEQGHYVNSDGRSIHSPAHTVDGTVPAGASARCGDGSYSFSTHRRGTCSHHGGVAAWL